jgi:cellulose synthase/poly-beta-1,6-N-acetylglucosamine synthase-like glycosyltransferase
MMAEIGNLGRMPRVQPEGDLQAAPGTAPITLLMATRNGAAYLPEQLASLAAQTECNWRLWVSDDGSTDATGLILAEFARHHPVRVLGGPQQGAAQNFLTLLCHRTCPPVRWPLLIRMTSG